MQRKLSGLPALSTSVIPFGLKKYLKSRRCTEASLFKMSREKSQDAALENVTRILSEYERRRRKEREVETIIASPMRVSRRRVCARKSPFTSTR